jgi:transcriptional regulator with XRE-family HTH domain
MVTQPAFGRRLREARRLRGLSQADVAGANMSASYISLVESGRRTPSPEIAGVIADRLGVPLEELTAACEEIGDQDGRLGLVSRLIAARSARANGDYLQARDILQELTDRTGGPDEDDALWEARWELSETLACLEEAEARSAVLQTLLGDGLTLRSPELHARVSATMADAARQCGALTAARRFAERALVASESLDATSADWVRSHITVMAVYADEGTWDRALELGEELLEVAEDIASRQLRGVTYWASSGIKLLAADRDMAFTLAAKADALIRPEIDIRLWARLQRAIASLHLAGQDPAGAQLPLRRARQALELVGTVADLALLAGVEAIALAREGDLSRALAVVAAMDPGIADLPRQEAARCEISAARILRLAGRTADSAKRYAAAAALYEQAGAYRLANDVWRESLSNVAIDSGQDFDRHGVLMP